MAPPVRRSLGQHFLHDPSVIRRIVEFADPDPNRRVVEIGPGRGALTSALLQRAGHLDVVEKDRLLAEALARQYPPDRLSVHQADALRFDFAALAVDGRALQLIGNLPYNISTPLLFHLLGFAPCITDMVFMVQKEVAERILAAPGSKAYGRLSVMIQWRCEVHRGFHVGPGAFHPPPKVDSSVLRLTPRRQPDPVDPGALERVVRDAFGQRRKQIRNALSRQLDETAIRAAGVDPGARAGELAIGAFVALGRRLAAGNDPADPGQS